MLSNVLIDHQSTSNIKDFSYNNSKFILKYLIEAALFLQKTQDTGYYYHDTLTVWVSTSNHLVFQTSITADTDLHIVRKEMSHYNLQKKLMITIIYFWNDNHMI